MKESTNSTEPQADSIPPKAQSNSTRSPREPWTVNRIGVWVGIAFPVIGAIFSLGFFIGKNEVQELRIQDKEERLELIQEKGLLATKVELLQNKIDLFEENKRSEMNFLAAKADTIRSSADERLNLTKKELVTRYENTLALRKYEIVQLRDSLSGYRQEIARLEQDRGNMQKVAGEMQAELKSLRSFKSKTLIQKFSQELTIRENEVKIVTELSLKVEYKKFQGDLYGSLWLKDNNAPGKYSGNLGTLRVKVGDEKKINIGEKTYKVFVLSVTRGQKAQFAITEF